MSCDFWNQIRVSTFRIMVIDTKIWYQRPIKRCWGVTFFIKGAFFSLCVATQLGKFHWVRKASRCAPTSPWLEPEAPPVREWRWWPRTYHTRWRALFSRRGGSRAPAQRTPCRRPGTSASRPDTERGRWAHGSWCAGAWCWARSWRGAGQRSPDSSWSTCGDDRDPRCAAPAPS